jgi:hypothetical protein
MRFQGQIVLGPCDYVCRPRDSTILDRVTAGVCAHANVGNLASLLKCDYSEEVPRRGDYFECRIDKPNEIQLGSLGPLIHSLVNPSYEGIHCKVKDLLLRTDVHDLPHHVDGLSVELRDEVVYASGVKSRLCVQRSHGQLDGAWYSPYNSPSGHSSTRYTANMPWPPSLFSGAAAQRWLWCSGEDGDAEEQVNFFSSLVARDSDCSEDDTGSGSEDNIDPEQEFVLVGLSRHPIVCTKIYCTNRSSLRAHNCTPLGHGMEGHGWVSYWLL